MNYYNKNKEYILTRAKEYYRSEEQKIKRDSIEWQLKQQSYQHQYYVKHREDKLRIQKLRQQLNTLIKNMKKSKILKERKRKKQNDYRRVKRYIKTYKRVLTDETLEITFD